MKENALATTSTRQSSGSAIRGDAAVGQQLLPLAGRKAGSAVRAVFELGGGRIVLIDGDVAYRIDASPAPAGDYPLLHAGRVVVTAGRAVAVIGQPAAPALSAPVD